MTDAKLQYSIKVGKDYNLVLEKGKQYLDYHRDLVPKKSPASPIFISDVFQYALDLLADHLDIDFKNNDADLEIVDEEPKVDLEQELSDKMANNLEFRKNEYLAVAKMTPEMVTDYETNYKPGGLSCQEYLKFKAAGL